MKGPFLALFAGLLFTYEKPQLGALKFLDVILLVKCGLFGATETSE